jgi:hypothetical protein
VAALHQYSGVPTRNVLVAKDGDLHCVPPIGSGFS